MIGEDPYDTAGASREVGWVAARSTGIDAVVDRHPGTHMQDDRDRPPGRRRRGEDHGGSGTVRAISAPSTSKQVVLRPIRVSPTSCMSEAVHRILAIEASSPRAAAIAAPQQYDRTEWDRRYCGSDACAHRQVADRDVVLRDGDAGDRRRDA